MAITVVNQKSSNTFHPVANPINVTVNSNNSGNCNFRYICDIYINGTKVFRDKLFPDPSTGYGFFQLARIIQDYADWGLPLSTQTTGGFYNIASNTRPNSMLSVYCKFGEEYDISTDCSGSVSQYLNLVTSNTFYAFNGVVDYEDFPSFDYTDYLLGQGSWGTGVNTEKFLTNSPRTLDIGYDDSYYLNFYSLTAPTSNAFATYIAIRVTTYYKAGGTNVWDIPVTAAMTLNAYKHYRIAVGPYNINEFVGAGPFPITQWVYKYDVQLINSSNLAAKSETFTFNLKTPTENKTRIGFVGLLGNTEYFNFFHRNKKMTEIERKNYRKTLNSNYSGVWSYRVGDRSETTYSIKAQEKHTVASYVNRDDSAWLSELFLSPEVWVNKGPKTLCFTVYPNQVFSYGGGAGVDIEVPASARIGPIGSGTTKLFFRVGKDHGLQVGDQFYCYPDDNNLYVDYNNMFTVLALIGDDAVDCGVTYGIFSLTNYVTGFLVKSEPWVRLPVTLDDKSVEEKVRTSKPIEYTINYSMAYEKNTLR